MSRRRRGKMDWKQRRREEADQGVPVSQGWLTGIEGRRFHCCLLFSCFGALCFSFYFPLRSSSNWHTQIWPTHMHANYGGASYDRWRGMGWERHAFARRWIIQPVINYNLAWQRQGLGEFLCWSGLQLIVFFLPVQSNVRAEQRPNGVLDAWTSDAGPHCWSCCITWSSLMGKDCTLQTQTAQWEFNTHFTAKKVNVDREGLVGLKTVSLAREKEKQSGITFTSRFLSYVSWVMIGYCLLFHISHTNSYATLTQCK